MNYEQIIIRGLRRRVHMLEGHNQHFERCESLWCNPIENIEYENPAYSIGKNDKWPNGEAAVLRSDTEVKHG